MTESLPAISEWCEPSAKNPSRKPAFRGGEALEALNGFQSAVQLLVVALDEICGFRAAVVEEILCPDVTGEKIAVVEDVFERVNLERIIVVPWRSPTNVTLEIRLAEVWEIEDLLFQIGEKTSVRLFAADFERSSDVLEEVDVAELDDDIGVDGFGRHADGFVVVADERLKCVSGVLELREILEHRLVVLGGGQQADGNVVGEVVDAVNERNLVVIAFHGDELPIDDEEATETFGIAVTERDIVVVGQCLQFGHNASVGCVDAFADSSGNRADAGTLQMQREQGLCFASVIDGEALPAIIAEVPSQAISRPFLLRAATATEFAEELASCSVFFGVNMFKVEKRATTSYKVPFSGTRNRTLSFFFGFQSPNRFSNFKDFK